MTEIASLLRKLYCDRLSGLNFAEVPIPVWDTFERSEALLNAGIYPFYCYVLIKDITINDDSPKCSTNEDVTVQVQVVTKFNANTGESLYSERIGQQVLNGLFVIPFTGKFGDAEVGTEFTIWKTIKESVRQINSETATQRIFTRNYIFSHKITS